MPLLESFLNTVAKYRMLCPGDRIVVGVSGGPDSVALLHLLVQTRDRFDIAIHVAHLNHMIRGEEADGDENYVRQLARSFGLELTVRREDVPGAAERFKLSLEDAARAVRYRFFEEVAGRIGANKIAVGHTLDDQAETVIMRAIRGTGLDGLGGIPPVRPMGTFTIVRPLIDTLRTDIEEYCKTNGLETRIDSTNKDPLYFRNSIRLEVIPLLAKYNLKVKVALGRMAELVREDKDTLEVISKDMAGELVTVKNERGSVAVSLDGFIALPKGLQRRVLRRAIMLAGGSLEKMGYVQMENVLSFMISGKTRGRMRVPGGLRAYRGSRAVTFSKAGTRPRESKKEIQTPVRLKIPGVSVIPWADLRIQARVVAAQEADFGDGRAGAGRTVAYFDYDKVVGHVFARRRHPGDRFCPFGMKGRKKVKDFLISSRVPVEDRDRLVLVVCEAMREEDVSFRQRDCSGTGDTGDSNAFCDASYTCDINIPNAPCDMSHTGSINIPNTPPARPGAPPSSASSDIIMWVVGHRTDERFRVTQDTRTVLRLKII